MDLNFCLYMFSLLCTSELNLKKLRAMYCNPDVSLRLRAVFTISIPLNVMLLALPYCSLMTALLQDGWTQIQKVHRRAPQRSSWYGMEAMQHKVTDLYLLLSRAVRKCRKDPSATAKLLHLGSTSLALQSQTLACSWLGSTATSQDFPPPFPTQRCSCQRINLCLFLPSLTKCCAAILHRIRVSRAGLIFANSMAGLIYSQL